MSKVVSVSDKTEKGLNKLRVKYKDPMTGIISYSAAVDIIIKSNRILRRKVKRMKRDQEELEKKLEERGN